MSIETTVKMIDAVDEENFSIKTVMKMKMSTELVR